MKAQVQRLQEQNQKPPPLITFTAAFSAFSPPLFLLHSLQITDILSDPAGLDLRVRPCGTRPVPPSVSAFFSLVD